MELRTTVKLIKAPWRAKRYGVRGVSHSLRFLADVEGTKKLLYTSELAAIVDLPPQVILHRLQRREWDDPAILAPLAKKGYTIEGEIPNKQGINGTTRQRIPEGNAAWQSMRD